MISIRRQLLQWLLLGIALSSAVSGVFVYRHTRSEIDELYNAHLEQLAIVLAQHLGDAAERPADASIIPAAKALAKWKEETYLIQLWDKRGQLRDAASPVIGDLGVAIPLQPRVGFYRHKINDQVWRIYRADGEHLTVQIAQPEAARSGIINETSLRMLLPLTLQIPLLVFCAWIAVRRGLRPLDQLSNAIAQRQPNALIPLNALSLPIDLQPLVHTLNALLERLNGALQQQRNFVADAAHELRTPLAALQLQLDLLMRASSQEDRDLTLSLLSKGIQRATNLVQQLLQFAHSEAPVSKDYLIEIPLHRLAAESIERYLPAARLRGIDLGVIRLEPVSIRCVTADIEAVLDNLLSNAIRYTPIGGKVDLAIFAEQGDAIIDVIDTGIGIPESERARIFDRFYRVLTLHGTTNSIEGSGLGLAIVKALCERYGAAIEISSGPNGAGTHFRVRWRLSGN